MGSESLPLRQRGIYHNLPTFDPSITNLRAIVTGANGISGFYTMRVLLQSPERWSMVYALSRKPPPEAMMALLSKEERARVQHVACDFLDSSQAIASTLRSSNVTATHVFFYSYNQPKPPQGSGVWSNAEELVKVNGALLDNFLQALTLADIHPSRVLLQTGAKHYGVFSNRPVRTPAVESDPQPEEPNFYYKQEAILLDYCKANPGTSWNVIRPAWIVGAVTNQINGFLPFGIYAAVQAQKKEALSFPSDRAMWQYECHHSTAMLTGYLSEWAVLEEKCKNQAFNSQDTSPLSWDRVFEELARWFDVEKGVTAPEEDENQSVEAKSLWGKEIPMEFGSATTYRTPLTFTKWAQDPVNSKTWKRMMESSDGKLTQNPFTDIETNFPFGDLSLPGLPILCMNKARRLGWTGFVDTMESLFEAFSEMGKLGILPPMKVDAAKPLI